MKALKNIIIVGEKTNFISMTYENMYKPVKYVKYPNLKSAGQNNTNTINGLSIINKFLAEIYQNKNEESNVHYFVIPNNICKSIKSGTYKNWIKTGKTASGKILDKQELYEWAIFASLYKALFTEIDFKPISYYSMKEIKYNQKHMMFAKELISTAYKYLELDKKKSFMDTLEDIM